MAEGIDLLDGFQLGPHKVFPRREQITVDGEKRHVEPKVMHVLVSLAERAQQTVTRDELLDKVWGDVVVGDEVVSRAISLLRTLLDDDRRNPRFIRTIPRAGYELIVEALPIAARDRSFNRKVAGVAGASALIVLGLVWWAYVDAEPARIAVLPFAVADNPNELGVLRQALAEDVLALVDSGRGITGIAKRSSFALNETLSSIESVGESLDANYIVDGDLTISPQGQLRVTMYLVDVDTGTNLWTAQMAADDGSALQQVVVAEIREALATHAHAAFPRSAQRVTPLDQDAYRAYLEAKYQWSVRGERRMSRSIDLLRDAIALQPDFAEAHLALAQALAIEPFYNDKAVAAQFAQARSVLADAVALDAGLRSDSLALEGFMLMRERRWEEALANLEHALDENPDSALGNYWYATILAQIGDYDRSAAFAERALALDPSSAVLGDRAAVSNMWAGKLDRAAQQYELAFKLGYVETVQPKSYAMFLYRSGRFEDMVEVLLRAGLPARWGAAFAAALGDPSLRPAAVAATREAIAAGAMPVPYQFGIWLLLGEGNAALAAFDMSLKNPDAELLWAEEAQILRDHAAFDELLHRLNLSAYEKP